MGRKAQKDKAKSQTEKEKSIRQEVVNKIMHSALHTCSMYRRSLQNVIFY